MGITGLLPFLEKKTARKISIEEFSGGTAAVDTYCWLHKGVFTCADKLAMGVKTDGYVTYCMNYVNLLLKFRIKPILVFDGRHLPAKAETELKRREQRQANRKRASELMKMGEIEQGKNLLKRAIDVSHEMALEVIKKCQALNIDCIVAPYEADAQLAYLNISGIADFVITEDSDLTLFGCKKILFKMDKYGHGTLVEQDRLYMSMALRQDDFTIDKFRHMCILSGCDYLASLPGVGLVKALKFVQRTSDDDIYNALGRLGSHLNKNLTITKEYREAFVRAVITFKHQLVYCPLKRQQVRLSSPPPEVTREQLHHAGDPVDEELAYQLALGNCNPFGFKKLNNFDPDHRSPPKKRTNGWHEAPSAKHSSIWSCDFKVKAPVTKTPAPEVTSWPNTVGADVVMNTRYIKKKISPSKEMVDLCKESSPLKRSSEHLDKELSKEDLFSLYSNSKITKSDGMEEAKETVDKSEKHFSTPMASPKKINPFLKRADTIETSPSLVPRGRKRPKHTNIGFQPTVVDETVITQSRFFARSGTSKESKHVIIPETQDELIRVEPSLKNLGRNIIRRNIIIEETQEQMLDKSRQVQIAEIKRKIEERVEHVIIPETMNHDEMAMVTMDTEETNSDNRYRTPRSSFDGGNANVIIPESPDEEDLPLSQGSGKENDDSVNILGNDGIRPLERELSLSRGDSGVDMKEDTMVRRVSPDTSSSELVEEFSKIETKPLGLKPDIKKYGLKKCDGIRAPSPDDFEEIFCNPEPLNKLRSSFFKWSDNKPSGRTVNVAAERNLSQSRGKGMKRPQASKKLPQIDSQQSLLNMYGFRRKDSLKH